MPDVPDASSGFIVTGLNYTDAAGNALVVSGGAWQTNAAMFFGQARRASTATVGAAGTTRWMSFLVKQVVAPTGVDYAAIAPGTGYSFGSPAIAGGVGNGTAFVNYFYCQGGGTTSGGACGSLTYDGVCENGNVKYCFNGAIQYVTCGSSYPCGMNTCGTGANCCASTSSSDPCDSYECPGTCVLDDNGEPLCV
jgi:hypothetical protein